MIGDDGGSMSRLPADGYQQYQTESTLQVHPKHDEYYSVSPGENYYATEYDGVDQNQAYSTNVNFDNSHEMPTSSSVGIEQNNRESSISLQQQQHQSIEYSTNIEPTAADTVTATDIRVPNYLQSDTDDSQPDYQNSNKTQPDSDFDFSTNSEMN